ALSWGWSLRDRYREDDRRGTRKGGSFGWHASERQAPADLWHHGRRQIGSRHQRNLVQHGGPDEEGQEEIDGEARRQAGGTEENAEIHGEAGRDFDASAWQARGDQGGSTQGEAARATGFQRGNAQAVSQEACDRR